MTLEPGILDAAPVSRDGLACPTASTDTALETPSITPSRPRSLISNGLWNLFFTVWSTAVTFFLTPFLISRIGTDHYGLFVLLMSISGMMGILNLGLGEATLRYVAFYYGRNSLDGINRVVGATFSVYIVMGMIGWAGLFFGAEWIVSLLRLSAADQVLSASLLRLTAINFGLGFLSGPYGSIPQALQRFDISTKVNIAQSVFHVAGTVTILSLGMGIYELVLWSVATALFMLVINTVVAKRLIPGLRLRPRPSRDGLKEVLAYGVFSFLSQIVGMLWYYGDRILLGAFVGVRAVGYLTVPQEIVLRLMGLVSGAGSVLTPRFSAMEQSVRTARLYIRSTAVLLFLTAVLFTPVAVLLPDFLRLWVSPDFAATAGRVGQTIAASCIVRGAFLPYESLFRGMGKPQFYLRVIILASTTSFVTAVVLIPRYGLLGAGVSFCTAPIWGLVTIAVTWFRVLQQKSFGELFRGVFWLMLAAYGCMGIAMWLRGLLCSYVLHWPGLLIAGTVTALLVAGVMVGAQVLVGSTEVSRAIPKLLGLRRLRIAQLGVGAP